MKVQQILGKKGHDVVTITEFQTIFQAIQMLVEHNIGALVVTDGEHRTGILSERDILRLTARRPNDLGSIEVREVMTRNVITTTPEKELTETMDVMTEHRIRHLPVLDGDQMIGIVSIGDLLKTCRDIAEQENLRLREYIKG